MSSYNKLKLQNVLFITITWVALGVLIAYYNHYIGKSFEELEYQSYDLETNIITNVFSTFVAGFLGGTVLVFFLKDKFRKKPLGLSIIIYVVSMMSVIIVLTIIAYSFYYYIYEGAENFDETFFFQLSAYLGTNTFWLNMITWTLIATLTIIGLHINDKYGHGVFLKLLLGKYHRPQYEHRVFMFLDMRSSTTIAEELGHRNYFKMLNEVIELITKPIVNSKGEIYQYVGDEVVVTWLLDNQDSKHNAIQCFFAIRDRIRAKSDYFQKKFSYVPSFKAGMHCGDVTTGEIGTYKKEIVFTGDTVNTTSRIQGICSQLGEQLLISESLYKEINDITPSYNYREISEIELKGKKNPVKLYAVAKATHEVKPLDETRIPTGTK